MGFFSAIKKFLGGDSKEDANAAVKDSEGAIQQEQSIEPAVEETVEVAPEQVEPSHSQEETTPASAEEKDSESVPSIAPEEAQVASEESAPAGLIHTDDALVDVAVAQMDTTIAEEEISAPSEEDSQTDEELAHVAVVADVAPEVVSEVAENVIPEAPVVPEVSIPEPVEEAVQEVLPEPEEAPEAPEVPVVPAPATSVAPVAPVAPVTQPAPQEAAPAKASYSGLSAEDQGALSLSLRSVEPRLSAWLGVVTEGISEVSPLLWQRLRFLLESLEAKESEAEAFVQDFQGWLNRMEYEYVEEFRSELQYRLALALELEDEEDERNRLFVKLSDGLARTREHFTRKLDVLFASHGALDAAFWEEMEELFIMADVGFESSMELISRLKDAVRKQGLTEPQQLRAVLQEELLQIFHMQKRISSFNAPEVIMMIGVNGVGKTTTIAKLAHRDRMQGKKVLIAAADTFRAAATEQLGVWAERVGADFHRKEAGADPAAVAYEAMDLALRGNYDVLYVDTAGRLQTKVNLMEELTKIRNVIAKKHAGAPHRSILVVDATTGQNALSQTKLFKEAAGIDEIILSKLDGTAKGGVAISVALQFQIPITYVGLGEKLEDLRPFNGKDFALALLGDAVASE